MRVFSRVMESESEFYRLWPCLALLYGIDSVDCTIFVEF